MPNCENRFASDSGAPVCGSKALAHSVSARIFPGLNLVPIRKPFRTGLIR
jgi:hypothetical protein